MCKVFQFKIISTKGANCAKMWPSPFGIFTEIIARAAATKNLAKNLRENLAAPDKGVETHFRIQQLSHKPQVTATSTVTSVPYASPCKKPVRTKARALTSLSLDMWHRLGFRQPADATFLPEHFHRRFRYLTKFLAHRSTSSVNVAPIESLEQTGRQDLGPTWGPAPTGPGENDENMEVETNQESVVKANQMAASSKTTGNTSTVRVPRIASEDR
ncbi:hypothetical protein Y032_0084g1696 [Ancylostoma ceylanicum]|uniref:Uncharacterized protein n=1 Tax=Ancylostoma ceylanicum TaxID=53326 RepID=A0A016TQD3_9BILA|nr:hypothetical protein Y032_0084g1696 [Ancylostoma ceylanicum]